MTYPQYPQQGMPPGYPAQYAPQMPAQNPMSAPPAPPAMVARPAVGQMPNIVDPPALGGTRPRIADLNGRSVLMVPKRIEKGLKDTLSDKPDATYDRITADILILDGGPLEFGGNPLKNKPHTMVVQTPYMAHGVFVSQGNLLTALEPCIASNQALSGRVTQGTANNPAHNAPWNLTPLKEDDPTRGMAGQILGQIMTGEFNNPTPTPKFGPPPQPAYVPQAAYQAPPQPQYAPQPAAPAPGSYEAWVAQQQQAPSPVNPANVMPEPPVGWTREQWQAQSPEVRAQVMANMGVQHASQAAPAQPGGYGEHPGF